MRKEVPYTHGSATSTAVVLVNLGTPDAPTGPALRRYLKQFLSDPRVVEIPRLIWWLILNLIILNVRPKKSAAKYATVWTPEGSPLLAIAKKQTVALQARLNSAGLDVRVVTAMRYGNPGVPEVMDTLRAQGCDRVLVLPMFPQYAAATTASAFDAVAQWAKPVRNLPELRFVKHFHDHPAYIRALADSVLAHWVQVGRPDFTAGDKLLMSFHGVPKQTLLNGDPYHCECLKTARLVSERLGLEKSDCVVTFQSRFGKAEWLKPYTDKTLEALAQSGCKRVDVMCPGFVADCLETLEEIADEGKETFVHAGGQLFNYIPCLNDSEGMVQVLFDVVQSHAAGWPLTVQESKARSEALKAAAPLALEKGAQL